MADQLIVRRWLASLGRLVAARSSHDEAADFVDSSTPMLAMRFPNEAFNPVSLEAVAAQCKYLPAYGELVPLLSSWWRQNRPMPAVLPPPAVRLREEEPTQAEVEHIERTVEETIAWLRSSAQPVEDRRPTTSRYLTRQQLAEAYRRAGVTGPKVDA